MRREDALNLLNKGFIHSVKDPLWGNIPFTDALKALLDTAAVEKLSRIKQNGPAYHIYPGAVHTRLSHSIGVYHIGREMLLSISRKSEELPFTAKGMMSFLSACLLHDIGHFPYAHSLKELSMMEHEEIARHLIEEDEELGDAIVKAGADKAMCALIIDKDAPTDDKETGIYRRILSGTLDPDKLDYLSRDAFFAGIPYGRQDTDYIITSLSLSDGRLVLDQSAISSVEQVLFSKYMMYRNLYWHKGVRSATAMIKKAILTALREGVITSEDLYLKDDYEFYSMQERFSSYAPFSLMRDVEHGRLLERKAWMAYREGETLSEEAEGILTRYKAEERILHALEGKYPSLKETDVVIDIPEPISFESDIQIMSPDGSVSDASDVGLIFQKAGKLFSASLRNAALYLPSYVSEEDAAAAFQEVRHGK